MIAGAAVLALALQFAAADIATRHGGRDVFPAAFHGKWASDPGECRDDDWVRFEADAYRAPDLQVTLIRHVGVRRHAAPGGEPAITLLSDVRVMAEGHVSRGRMRISRAGPFLYMSNSAVAGEREHWQNRDVRCPD